MLIGRMARIEGTSAKMHRARDIITVCPPNLDRTGFLSLDNRLDGGAGLTSRDWLLDRLRDGFQIRMLRAPRKGFIAFAPGRASWWPVFGADRCVVVQRLWVEAVNDSVALLLTEAEEWARYYGFWAVLALIGQGVDRCAEADLHARGYSIADDSDAGVMLCARILQGPTALPRLPRDWGARAAALGPGLVIQSAGHCPDQTARAEALVSHAREAGLAARLDRIDSAQDARNRLAAPGALFCVALDGEIIDTGQGTAPEIWQVIRRSKRL
ncbi:MAG: hypothetical protein COW55_06130 [Rhodobacteraceae bacterium CG17_big_fil_post_rev_8_21_14_2_50_65_11]|nr:MAG: hypothetical protein COW55_06130 [Rhodobacteraceae bacterium CG17_big_fil_post_rev_8_21_14_2_50_65_11]